MWVAEGEQVSYTNGRGPCRLPPYTLYFVVVSTGAGGQDWNEESGAPWHGVIDLR